MHTCTLARTLLLLVLSWSVGGSMKAAIAVDLRLRADSAHDLNLEPIEAGWQIETTGTDPYVITELSQTLATEDRVLDFEYVCTVPVKQPVVYYGPPIQADNRIELPTIPQAEGWHRYTADLSEFLGRDLPATTRLIRLDFGASPGVRLRIRNVKLRPLQPHELQAKADAAAKEAAKQKLDAAIQQYLASDFPHQIESVAVGRDSIRVKARWKQEAASAKLVEYPIEWPIGRDTVPSPLPFAATISSDGYVSFELPRRDRFRDRLHSAFALVDANALQRPLTPRTFATEFEPSNSPVGVPPKPRNQKGLSGLSRRGPESDLPELGISAVTINLVLNHFVSETGGPGRLPMELDGPPVYFNPSAFAAMDELMGIAKKHNLVVSAIVLIANHDAFQPTSPLIHREVSGGVYAMPDLTSAYGAGVYGFVLDKIAERYKDPTSSRGGITNWIAHNEVDFHHVWTNFGKQPRAVATETYYRSMRMIHNAARIHQPGARVFASLTHHWVVEDDRSGRQLAPREVIESLQRYSQLEGDFAWGVAYHPYPESLFAKVAWEDKSPTDDFDTPLITIQNLPVLGRFLEQASMRDSRGDVRPVLLSEQGFHTEDISDESQRLQAESLDYAMKQVRRMPIVESFHYHRWLDHPDEGGLNLGLRTVPTESHPYGSKKKSWDVYRAQ
ncbi:MAG: DUF5722 domain-containing protein [Planctomycetaceae bacterium]